MMTPASLWVPTSKYDVAAARLAVAAGYPAVAPVLDELLGCLRDLNWPVAHELFDFLTSVGAPLAPHLRRVFAGDDHAWQYGLCGLLQESSDLYAALRPNIYRIALSPNAGESAEELDKRCAELIAHHEPPDSVVPRPVGLPTFERGSN